MRFPEEVVVEEFLPTFRSLLAEDLRDRGLTQREVADAIGVSQSAVSKYVHGDVERRAAVAEDDRVRRTVERIGEGLAAGDVSPVEALGEAEALIRRLEDRDLVCELHEAAMPALAGLGCDFCVRGPDSELRRTERVLSDVRRGLRAIENASGFAGLIPAVGSNLVACTPDADGVEDVAGVPGRIFDVKGRAAIPGDPEFGVSEHVAGVLLAARAGGSEARAALNVRYDDALLAELSGMGHVPVEFDGEAEIREAVREAVAAESDATVLYQTGAFGIEPIVYLLGPDAETVAEVARYLV